MTFRGSVKTAPVAVLTAAALGAGAAAAGESRLAQGWPMAGANPQRTSWVPEEVRGPLRPAWWRRIEPYISQKVQLVAGYDMIYVSTARGLHALDAATGEEKWVFKTEIPLGHSPTLYDGVAYVGGFDRKIHAVDARTGEGLWTFTGGAGFQTSPLIVNGVVYAGCRNGVMYAVDAKTGEGLWETDVGSSIRFSAAYRDGRIFFGTADSHAHALDAKTGKVLWKSKKLPGAGFRSYWPVVYRDRVLFWGSNAYNMGIGGRRMNHKLNFIDLEAYPDKSRGAPVGPPREDGWVDASAFLDYFKRKPSRRTTFVLDLETGEEREIPPLIWAADDGSANRPPPVVGGDGNLWQHHNLYHSWPFSGYSLSAWEFGTPYISAHHPHFAGGDEAHGFSAGGNVIYWNHCSQRGAGAIDSTSPSPIINMSAKGRAGRVKKTGTVEWGYFSDHPGHLRTIFPEIRSPEKRWRFAYGIHGDRQGPIPYKGRVYMHVYNGVLALAPGGHELPKPKEYGPKAPPLVTRDVVEVKAPLVGVLTHLAVESGKWPALIRRRFYNQGKRAAPYYALCRIAASADGIPTPVEIGTGRAVVRSADGKSMTVSVSRRAPGMLCETDSSVISIRGRFVGAAYPAGGGTKTLSGSGSFSGGAMGEGWLLLWYGPEAHPYDFFHPRNNEAQQKRGRGLISHWMRGDFRLWSPTPILVSLQKRPRNVSLSGEGLTLTFDGAAGACVVTPFYGLQDNRPRAEEWAGRAPENVAGRARALHRAALAFPTEASEKLSIDGAGGDATISISCTHKLIRDDWGTEPLKLAYLPPELALAARGKSPIRTDGEILDLDYPVMLGRIAGVRGTDRATVTLPGIAGYWREPVKLQGAPVKGDRWQKLLVREVEKMIAAGHLRPGYMSSGAMDFRLNGRKSDHLSDYFHNPADTVYTLLQALPFLPADLREKTKAYVRKEYENYPPHSITHVGWADGARREQYDLPEEVDKGRSGFKAGVKGWPGWGFNPKNLYALALYAETFGGAEEMLAAAGRKLPRRIRFPCSMPYVLNTHIAGHLGYLRLAALAGQSAGSVEQRLVRLLILRAALSKYPKLLEKAGYDFGGYKWIVHAYDAARGEIDFKIRTQGSVRCEVDPWSSMGDYVFTIDYVNLVPELGRFLHDYAGPETREAVESYNDRAPYWFATFAEEFANEGTICPLYDVHALFTAKAYALGEPRGELEKWIDVPAFGVGDLFYVQNLVATLAAGSK